MRNDVTGAEIYGNKLGAGNKLQKLSQTLTGTLVVDADSPPLLWLDPGGAGRNVDLPAEADSDGLFFYVVNAADAAENLTVRNDAGGTVGVVGQAEMGFFVCDGTTWRHFTGVA